MCLELCAYDRSVKRLADAAAVQPDLTRLLNELATGETTDLRTSASCKHLALVRSNTCSWHTVSEKMN